MRLRKPCPGAAVELHLPTSQLPETIIKLSKTTALHDVNSQVLVVSRLRAHRICDTRTKRPSRIQRPLASRAYASVLTLLSNQWIKWVIRICQLASDMVQVVLIDIRSDSSGRWIIRWNRAVMLQSVVSLRPTSASIILRIKWLTLTLQTTRRPQWPCQCPKYSIASSARTSIGNNSNRK